jgi:cytochrome c oxidase subunit 1/cytochrome c oxidase subunit I+III
MGWNTVNMLSSIGSFMFALGILVFLVDVVYSFKRGPIAGSNPWDAPSLEWSVPSPPPPYNFAVLPIVASRHPLWEARMEEEAQKPVAARSHLDEGYILMQGREALGTTALSGRPHVILKMPEDSYAPFWLSVFAALLFAALAMRWWAATLLLLAACGVSIIVWLWPQRALIQREPAPIEEG